MINVLAEDQVFLNYGPVQMTLLARARGQAMTEQLQEAAKYVMGILADLAKVQKQARHALTLDETDLSAYPLPLRLMVEAVLEIGDLTLTPMAAVAGTFADLAGDWLVEKGASKVMINNGGDIAIRLLGKEKTKLGLTPSIEALRYSHILNLTAGDGIGGVATSGLGGRSFTKGIASAVTVVAKTARAADACATLIANHCFTEDPGILRLHAEQLDPNTDIPGQLVTVKVGDLSPQTKIKALENGLSKAIELRSQGCIHGAVIFLDDLVVMIPDNFCQTARYDGGDLDGNS
ncbi:UPF0280 family protein [Desulfosporosinus sp. BICA1-9]|uniref:UPF0280 family protein n=1 Tax=Desulfosporosinus sp. BICA1-9 TaxID=1531958 RepID=UPI00054B4378|nr:UPF0280 family protein [Desulfosporosinus sp. BICA1-9]KJS46156.1 MAG: hypothetical protein VR66_26800 [Peptococcaceae bacterium BRH_c23]KJS90066.1 MAG: hypothetical protein JL57_03770 [Desulfosporosinus sp. BICA1-9]